MKVDLNAPTISLDRRVCRLFPGNGYKFLQAFRDQRVGFLDFPDLEIPEKPISKATDLISRIARSQAVRDQFLKVGPGFDPSLLALDNFAKARKTPNRSRLMQALINFVEEAKAGDYVVLPEPIFQRVIRIGRITDETITSAKFPKTYGDARIPSRNINWLSKVPENQVSTKLSDTLRHQHPFSLLERSMYTEVFSLVHGSFVYDDRNTATIYNDRSDYLDFDAALLGVISKLAAAAVQSLDEGDASLTQSDLLSVLLRNPPVEYSCTQESDIHSPGFSRYTSGTIVPLVLAAVTAYLIGLSSNASQELEGPSQEEQLIVLNSAPDADPMCAARVSQASARVLGVIGTKRTFELCEAARAAAKRAGLRSSASPVDQP